MPFLAPVDFGGGPKNHVFGHHVGKNEKKGCQKRFQKKHEICDEFLAKNGRLWEVKLVLLSHACCEIGGLGVS